MNIKRVKQSIYEYIVDLDSGKYICTKGKFFSKVFDITSDQIKYEPTQEEKG
jgi:hypothetical protein